MGFGDRGSVLRVKCVVLERLRFKCVVLKRLRFKCVVLERLRFKCVVLKRPPCSLDRLRISEGNPNVRQC